MIQEETQPQASAQASAPQLQVKRLEFGLFRRYGRAIAPLLLLWLGILLTLALIYWQPATSQIDIGTSYARAYLGRFFADEVEGSTTYAYSGAESAVHVPGVGGGALRSERQHLPAGRRRSAQPGHSARSARRAPAQSPAGLDDPGLAAAGHAAVGVCPPRWC